MNETTPEHDTLEVYLKIIDYKRSVGTTQWTVLSLFATASQVIFVLSLEQSDRLVALLVRLFGFLIYCLGFSLYERYRHLNVEISRYLVELEAEMGDRFKFQQRLDLFHAKGLSTKRILLIVGALYLTLALALSFT